MARIRSVKPELPQDAKLARVSRDIRYHFVLLWTVADDAGFFRANARSLLGQLYPHDHEVTEADVMRMNAALTVIGLVAVTETPDGPIGCVANWKKHQKIDRPSKSHLHDVVVQHSRTTREGAAHGVLSLESRVLSPDLDVIDERAGDRIVPNDEPTVTPLYLAIWANGAISEKWGEQPAPLTHGSATELASALRTAGIEPGIVKASIYRQCRESSQPRPPRSVNYFRSGIASDWDAEVTRRAIAASGETAPPSRSAGGVSIDDGLARWAAETEARERGAVANG